MLTHGLSDQGANGLPRLSPPYKGQLSLVWGLPPHPRPQYPHPMLRIDLSLEGEVSKTLVTPVSPFRSLAPRVVYREVREFIEIR